ncbi:MAG: glutamate--tRNA ligase [Marinilabiliaceae bacterium]|nr:glutamate--tRNA ligase [Marinilabiliaceae bacterium]
MNKAVRVRFAPSPTGPLHIGGVRTALYNYLFARKNRGKFILRIEDTDRTRFVEGAEEYINESLQWCGIEVDEGVRQGGDYGPYRQSERKDIYRQYVEILIASGKAYYAFDTPEELDNLRSTFESRGEKFMYNSLVRGSLKNSLTLDKAKSDFIIESGAPYVVRFKMPAGEEIIMNDIIRGQVSVNSSTQDDKILFKSDGMPTYHLANIVDDHLMQISHVIRGEEWLPSLPLHVMLYRAFGWEEPEFAHLPLLLKPAGKGKLSKRDGDKMGFPVFPLFWPYGETASGYREEGYLPEAFVNMLALLGWNPGTEQEIFNMDELIGLFTIERVSKSGARFDPEKAKWFNHHYLQEMKNEDIAKEFDLLLKEKGIVAAPLKLLSLIAMVKERATFVKDIWDQADFFFIAPTSYDSELVRKRWKEDSPGIMTELIACLEGIDDFSSENTEKHVKSWISENELNMGAVMNAFRLLIVGESRGPHLFDIIAWLGKEETIARLKRGLDVLSS